MKNFFSILLFGLIITLTSCGEDGPPQCIDDLADTLEVCRGGDNPGDLTKWEFNGREVYCFNYGSCTLDNKAVIYDEDCNEICSLFGLSENTLCEGIEWDGNASLIETIYTF